MYQIPRLSLYIGLAALIILAVLMPGIPMSAADDAEVTAIGDVTDPGILPDSRLYFIKSWGRSLQLMFAGSDTERARLMLRYSNVDALALNKVYEMGKYDVGTKHAEQYALQIENTVQVMEKVRGKRGEKVSEELVNQLEQNYLRQQEVLLSALEKIPEPAQYGLLNVIENSNKHVGTMIMAQRGQTALQQYQERINHQTMNIGEETRVMVQHRLEVKHGQDERTTGNNSPGQGVITQTQTQVQTQIHSSQPSSQHNMQNQEAGQSNGNTGIDAQGIGNRKQGT